MTNPPTPIHVHMVYGCPLIWYIFLIALYWRLTWLGEQVNPLKVTVVWHHFPWIITNKRWSWPQQPSWWYDYQFIYQLENDYTIYYIKATQTSCSFILLFHENSRWIWAKKRDVYQEFPAAPTDFELNTYHISPSNYGFSPLYSHLRIIDCTESI